jgi:hypothetical protein
MTSSTAPTSTDVAEALAAADDLAQAGRTLDALDLLVARAAGRGDPAAETRLAELRYAAFPDLPAGGFDRWPPAAEGVDRAGPPVVPEIDADALTADVARRNILSHGSLLVRDLFTDHAPRFIDAIEAAFASRKATADDPSHTSSWWQNLPLPGPEAKSLGRYWVNGGGGMLACDSPRTLDMLFDAYTALGLREVVAEYLGERPVLSANTCTLRRVPLDSNTDWHQDGAFLGEGIRALNIWIALSDCGVDSPGMDLVPRRFDAVVETGTGGAIFDWAVGPDTVATVAPDAPPVRPEFRAGDALLFDDLYLHRTAIDPSMTRPRYAIESWFFAPTTYPEGQVPLVW